RHGGALRAKHKGLPARLTQPPPPLCPRKRVSPLFSTPPPAVAATRAARKRFTAHFYPPPRRCCGGKNPPNRAHYRRALPFKWTKQVASHFGGTRQGLAISSPARIKDVGGIRH